MIQQQSPSPPVKEKVAGAAKGVDAGPTALMAPPDYVPIYRDGGVGKENSGKVEAHKDVSVKHISPTMLIAPEDYVPIYKGGDN